MVQPLASETVIKKNVNSAFIGTHLKETLDDLNITTLVIVGLVTDYCVSTTVRMAGNYGYQTFLVSDATATFSKTGIDGQDFSANLMHHTALASLKDEFATIVNTSFLIENLR